ncbi:hypothetical protein ACFL40_03185, partial [candidate division KSB1 bacterium]
MNLFREYSYIFLVILFAVLGTLFITSDPPLSLTGHHTPWVDPPVYLDTVKSKILTGEWNSSAFQIHYPVYIYPVYWMFMLFGQSYFVLRIFSVLSVTAGLFFILTSLKKHIDSRFLFWGSFFLINYVLVMYSRLGLHHCFMFIWTGLSVYFVSREPDKVVYIFLSGVCAALAFLTVFYAFIFIVPLFIFILCETVFFTKQLKSILVASGGFLLVLLIYLIAFRLSIEGLFNYLISVFIEKKTQFHGPPTAHSNVIWQTRFFFGRMPFLTYLSGLFFLIILFNIKQFYRRFLWFERLGFIWLGFGIIMLAVFQYRPIRYHLIILPPMILLVIGFLRNYGSSKSVLYNQGRKYIVILSALFITFFLLLIDSGIIIIPDKNFIYYMLLLGFFLIIMLTYLYNKKIFSGKYGMLPGIVSTVVFTLGINIFQYYYYFIIPHDNTIVKASRDLPVILNDNAVIDGTYANIL